MVQILDGRSLAQTIRNDLKEKLQDFTPSPHLVIFLSYADPASKIYVKNKLKACQEVGIRTTLFDTEITSTEALLEQIDIQNTNADVDGILVQLPLHPNVDQQRIIASICPEKDVDGLTPINLGKLVLKDPSGFIPCTPLGIQMLLTSNGISLSGKHVVIIGRGLTVGRPLSILLSQTGENANATVTLANSRTQNLSELCKSADILVCAVGKAGLVNKNMVKRGAVIVDVGINRNDGRLVGDVDFEDVQELCSAISPVPGGVGPMTIASLLSNTLKSFSQRRAE